MVLQNRSPKYWRTIRNTFGLFEKHFLEANEPKKAPKYISDRKGFRTIFEKRTPIYSLAAPLLGLAKSIYYISTIFLIMYSPPLSLTPYSVVSLLTIQIVTTYKKTYRNLNNVKIGGRCNSLRLSGRYCALQIRDLYL